MRPGLDLDILRALAEAPGANRDLTRRLRAKGEHVRLACNALHASGRIRRALKKWYLDDPEEAARREAAGRAAYFSLCKDAEAMASRSHREHLSRLAAELSVAEEGSDAEERIFCEIESVRAAALGLTAREYISRLKIEIKRRLG